jgi:hypothetical protein
MAKETRVLDDVQLLSVEALPNVWGHGFTVERLAPAEVITDPDRAEQLGLTADARRMRREREGP